MPYGQDRIPIGARREKVAIQEAVTVDDGMGGTTITKWRTISEPWANVQALDERQIEAMAGNQLTARQRYHVVIPYQTIVAATQRIIVRDTTMEIQTATDDEGRRRRLVLYVGEVQA